MWKALLYPFFIENGAPAIAAVGRNDAERIVAIQAAANLRGVIILESLRKKAMDTTRYVWISRKNSDCSLIWKWGFLIQAGNFVWDDL